MDGMCYERCMATDAFLDMCNISSLLFFFLAISFYLQTTYVPLQLRPRREEGGQFFDRVSGEGRRIIWDLARLGPSAGLDV